MATGVGRENGGRRKIEERRKNAGRNGWMLYKARTPTLLAPYVSYRAPRTLAHFLWDPAHGRRAPKLMVPIKCIRVPTIPLWQGVQGVRVPRRAPLALAPYRSTRVSGLMAPV
jgi:hypothetical protein